ncbi:MAG: MFS transporter, partial [Gammaproteobacteria bacterium]
MSGASARDWLQLFSNRRIAATLLLGFSSGLPLALVGGTLQAWFTVSGVDIVTIGFLGLVGQPYVYKFLWAPFMDRFVPPLLGRRRGWLLLTQIAVSVAIAAMAFFNPAITPGALSALALVVAFLSASQDIAVDAYRTDVLQPRERGLGAAVSVGGYRMAMIVSGGLALILADHIGWSAMYLLMAASMAIGVLGTLLGPEPEIAPSVPSSLAQAVLKPWQ